MLISPTRVAAVICHELAPSLRYSIELALPFFDPDGPPHPVAPAYWAVRTTVQRSPARLRPDGANRPAGGRYGGCAMPLEGHYARQTTPLYKLSARERKAAFWALI